MKKQLRGALAVAVAIGVAAPAYAQDAKAQEVLAKTRAALGGKKIEGLKALSLQSAVQRNTGNFQMQSEVEILLEMPDKYLRTDVINGPMVINNSTGFNGDKAIIPGNVSMLPGGGMMMRMGGGGAPEGEKPTPEQLAEIHKRQVRNYREEVSRFMLGWIGSAHPSMQVQYTYAGEAESPDGKAHVIDVKDNEGFAARLFIDQNNHLPLMVSYQGRQPRVMTSGVPMTSTQRPSAAAGATAGGGTQTRQLTEEERKKLQADAEKQIQQMSREATPMVEFSLFFDDWREVDGIQFPHVMRRATAGATNEEWTISKVKVNPKIDAKKFAVDTK